MEKWERTSSRTVLNKLICKASVISLDKKIIVCEKTNIFYTFNKLLNGNHVLEFLESRGIKILWQACEYILQTTNVPSQNVRHQLSYSLDSLVRLLTARGA
jgi:hypothetical protein